MCVCIEERLRVGVAVVLSMVCVEGDRVARKLMVPTGITEAIRVPFAHSVTGGLVHFDNTG
jgi:hypothetical protein